jgi:hypothetical protein
MSVVKQMGEPASEEALVMSHTDSGGEGFGQMEKRHLTKGTGSAVPYQNAAMRAKAVKRAGNLRHG